MKVAIYCESAIDEAVLRIFVDALLGRATEPIAFPWLRSRGWPSVPPTLPKVLLHLHYHTDAEAFAVVVDSNGSQVYRPSPQQPIEFCEECRLLQLRKAVDRTKSQLAAIPGRGFLKTAIGLAVPQIEAWYRVGRDPQVNEMAWVNGLNSEKPPYSQESLKRAVYGVTRPSELTMKIAIQEAERIVRDGKLPELERLFPAGFGTFANEVRGW